MPSTSTLRSAILLLLGSFGMSYAAEIASVSPEGPFWSAGAGFAFVSKPKDSSRSLSGIACPAELGMPRRCIAVFDEGVAARYVVVDGKGLAPEPEDIVLLPGGKELDAEGAARDGAFVFVAGSHSAKRGDCSNNPDGRHVFRFGVDPATGKARLGANGAPADVASDDGRLWNLMTRHSVLRAFAGDNKCLGADPPPKAPQLKGLHGINIEGIAAKEGWLYFGFRAPAIDGKANILRVAATPLFTGGDLSDTLFTITVGKGGGIRDLLAVPEGLLLLIGPNDDTKSTTGWSIAFWDGAAAGGSVIQPKVLAHLVLPPIRSNHCDKEIKPEAMTMLENGPDFRRLLILSDGMCDGGALAYRIPK